MSLSDQEKELLVRINEPDLIKKGWIRCVCNNLFPPHLAYCPFCRTLNKGIDNCPTCGAALKVEEEIAALKEHIETLKAEIVKLKTPGS